MVPLVLWYGWHRGGRWRVLAIVYPAMAVAVVIGTKSDAATAGLVSGLAATALSPVVRRPSRRGAIALVAGLGLGEVCAVVATLSLLPPVPVDGMDSLSTAGA